MKRNNRGRLYKTCVEYIKTLTINQEMVFLDPELDCPSMKSKLEGRLEFYEQLMLDILSEED